MARGEFLLSCDRCGVAHAQHFENNIWGKIVMPDIDMMGRCVMFCPVVGKVGFAGAPIEAELELGLSVP